MNNWSDFNMNQTHLIYHSPIHGKGLYINSVKLIFVLSIRFALILQCTDPPHFPSSSMLTFNEQKNDISCMQSDNSDQSVWMRTRIPQSFNRYMYQVQSKAPDLLDYP